MRQMQGGNQKVLGASRHEQKRKDQNKSDGKTEVASMRQINKKKLPEATGSCACPMLGVEEAPL